MNESKITDQQILSAANAVPAETQAETKITDEQLMDAAKSAPSNDGGAGTAFLAGAVRSALIDPARGFANLASAAPGPLGIPFKIIQSLKKLGVKPYDPTQKFVGRPAEELGEFAGLFAPGGAPAKLGKVIGEGTRILPRILRSPAIGAAFGAIGGAEQGDKLSIPAVEKGAAIGAPFGALAGALQKPISKLASGIERTALGSRMEKLFGKFMTGLRGELTPEQAEQELSKVGTQRGAASEFINTQKNGLKSEDVPEVLKNSVVDLNKKVNDESRTNYSKAYSLAKEGGDFDPKFSTASKSAKNLLDEENELRKANVPDNDMSKIRKTLEGISEGGGEKAKVRGTEVMLKIPSQQNFVTATKSMQRLKEMAQRFRSDNNHEVSGKLGGLANDIKTDLENSLKEKSPNALSAWEDANKHWMENVLPLRTQNVQKVAGGSAEFRNLHSELLDQKNDNLPNVLNQLDSQGKKALAYQAFKDADKFNPVTEKQEGDSRKLIDIFEKKYSKNKPFLEKIIGKEGIANLENMQKNKLIGVNENIDRLSKGLEESGNAQKIARLSPNDRNLILYNHLKDSITPENTLDQKSLVEKLRKIDPEVRRALTGTGTEGERNLNDLEKFSRSELLRKKVADVVKKPATKKFIKGLGRVALVGLGAREFSKGESGRGSLEVGLGLLPSLPFSAALRENIAVNPEVRLAVMRALRKVLERSPLPISADRKPLDLTLTRGRRK